jgi:hypothetical protein
MLMSLQLAMASQLTLKSMLCYDRWSAGQPVSARSPHLGTKTIFLLYQTVAGLLKWGALSQGEQVWHLKVLLALARAIIGSEPCGRHYNILLSWIHDSPKLMGQVPILIFLRSRVAQLTPLVSGFFLPPPMTNRTTMEIFGAYSATTSDSSPIVALCVKLATA